MSRGLQIGRQNQVYASGSRASSSVFNVKTIEDVSSISRNISAIETPNFASKRVSTTRCYFVDERLYLDTMLITDSGYDGSNKILRGLRK